MYERRKHNEIIKRSHERSIKYGVDRERIFPGKILSREDAFENMKKNNELLRIAAPFMKTLYDFLVGTGFIVVLTDKESCILSIWGDNDILEGAKELNMVVGAYMDEKSIGTNAMGTAISENSPIQISAREHFITAYHRWTCSAAPIHDPSGKIIGTLNLTGASNLVHPHTLVLVVAAVRSIENHLKSEMIQKKLIEVNNYNNTIMNSISYGIIAFNKDGVINSVNNIACIMLKSEKDKLLNKSIEEFLNNWQELFNECIDNDKFIDEEITLKVGQKKEKYIGNMQLIKDSKGNSIGTVLTLKEMKSVIELVNKYTNKQARYSFHDMIGESSEMLRIVECAKQVANSPLTILIEGESGTGKEVLAQAIHNYSDRRENGFIAINCGAISSSLIESELFGYEEGAFTGAKKGGQLGKFELASGGTLFLDEIGEMPLELQVNLLRVLQEGYITRVGGSRCINVDVRIIAATNKDLKTEVEKGNFRQDLYYRLSVIPITLPSLRDRKSDIKLFVNHFLKLKALKLGRKIPYMSDNVMSWICNNDWYGNIRELENYIEKFVILEGKIGNNFIDSNSMNKMNNEFSNKESASKDDNSEEYYLCSLEQLEKKAIEVALKKYNRNITKVSEVLGISRNTLYLKMKKYSLE